LFLKDLALSKGIVLTNRTLFHLARHGQTAWNLEQRIQGQLDSELTALGQQQALQLARQCQSLQISQILTSRLGRALQTAKICASHLMLQEKVLLGIEERRFGLWEGKTTPEVQSEPDYVEITSQISDCKPTAGESSKQLLIRFQDALKQQFQQAPNDNYLIITHGDVMRCFMTQFQQAGQCNTGFDYKNGQFISLAYDPTLDRFLTL